MTKQNPPDDDAERDASPERSKQGDEEDYFLEIESHFAELRATPFVFSARDWALMKGWKDLGIPLSIVIEAMDDCFEKRSKAPRRKVISSLSYCRHAVLELWDDRKSLHVGGDDSMPETDSASRLLDLAGMLDGVVTGVDQPWMREQVARAASEIRAIPPGGSARSIEERLLEIEEALLSALERGFPAEQLANLHEDLERELAGFRFADEETKARTRKANLRRRLRQELAIPRLSLFG